MAKVVNGKVILNNGKVITPETGGFYDGAQYWNGTLGNPGEFNSQNNQAGQQGQAAVATQDQNFINQQRQQQNLPAQTYAQPSQPGVPNFDGGGGGAGGGYGTMFNQPSIDLNALNDKFTNDSGIKAKQDQLAQMEKDFVTAKGNNNDNPFLNEASRVGRQAKLEQLHVERTANLQNEIATSKADIQSKLDIASKQFDINSQQSQQAFSQLNQLISAGALQNASGEDIASITRATGVPSSMLYSIINKQKQDSAVKPTLVNSTKDNGEVIISAIDPATGKVINQTSLGVVDKATKPTNNTPDTNKYLKEAISILGDEDTKNNPRDKGDQKLAQWEQTAALQRITALVGGDPDLAWAVFVQGMHTGGFHGWEPGQ
jgi:hypothetical protein